MKRLLCALLLAVCSTACFPEGTCSGIGEAIDTLNGIYGDALARQDAGDFSDPPDYLQALSDLGDQLQAQAQAVCHMEGGH